MKKGLKNFFVGLGVVAGGSIASGAGLYYEAHQIRKSVEKDGYKEVGVSVNWFKGSQFIAKDEKGNSVSGVSEIFFIGTPNVKYDKIYRQRLK